ncbi:MAG: GNAT superfamily N-acetyltransferase [Flavobacteriales bacterium]|jgi:GNAT superfamily N-acetyltransferase
MELRTSRATIQDLPILLQFEQAIMEYERPFDPTLKPKDASYYDLSELIQSKKAEVLIVESEGKIIASGYASIEKADNYLQHKQYAHLGFMYVDPDFRGRGINKLILDGLIAWAKGEGINEFRLEVYAGNAGAIKAYEKVGFQQHLIEMRFGEKNAK